jgi:hypothetical protein
MPRPSKAAAAGHRPGGPGRARPRRARYARDPIRYERGMTSLLKATTMDTGR